MAKYQQGRYDVQNPNKYVGGHAPLYRSSWEYSFMRMVDTHPAVIAWASESHRIPYIHPITGGRKTYVPDFFIMYVDANGKKHAELVEIKPFSQIAGNAKSTHDKAHAIINQAKWNYARQFAAQQGIGFRVITENDMFNSPHKRKRK